MIERCVARGGERATGVQARPLLYLNLVLPMVVAFIPFSTAALADHLDSGIDEGTAVAFYAGTLMVMSAASTSISAYDSSRGLVQAGMPQEALKRMVASGFTVSALYGLAVIVSLLSPVAGVAGCAILALAWVVPTGKARKAREQIAKREQALLREQGKNRGSGPRED